MKKYLISIIALLLIFAFIPGCGNKAATPPANEASNTPAAGTPILSDKESQDLENALEALATSGWPTGKISDKVPEYPYGEVKNSGDYGGGEYAILISPTTKDEYKDYLTLLEGEGYTISSENDEARLGTLALRFQFNTSDTLQIIVSEAGSAEWPSFPGDLLPPEKGTLYGEVHIPNLTDSDKANGNYYTAGFSLVDLTEEDCYAYIQKQAENGWDVSYDMATKVIDFEGVTCTLSLQFVQFYDGQADFNLDAWKN